jgi:hypothetical protein
MLGFVGSREPAPPTAPDPIPQSRLRRARAIRRIALGTLFAFVLAGALGLFGIRTRTVTAAGDGYGLRLRYTAIDRSDQPLYWVLRVSHLGGFTTPIAVGVTQSYLDLLDINAIEPEPTSSRMVGPFVVWTFEPPPPGEDLRVLLDANIMLNARFGASATVAVFEGGAPVAQVHYRTWTAP